MQGILDERFDEMKSLQSEENPFFVCEMIDTYLQDANIYIKEITELLYILFSQYYLLFVKYI